MPFNSVHVRMCVCMYIEMSLPVLDGTESVSCRILASFPGHSAGVERMTWYELSVHV